MADLSVKKRKNKRLVISVAIITVALLLFSVLALMFYPLYGHYFKTRTSVEYLKTVTINGVESSYHRIDSLDDNSMVIPFIKGELIEETDDYLVYGLKIDLAKNYDYLIFEIVNIPTYEDDPSKVLLVDSEQMEEIKNRDGYFEIYKKQ